MSYKSHYKSLDDQACNARNACRDHILPVKDGPQTAVADTSIIQPTEDSQIYRQYNILTEYLSGLHCTISTIEQRLNPVLRGVSPKKDESNNKEGEYLTPLAQGLYEQNAKLLAALHRLEGILNSIDL